MKKIVIGFAVALAIPVVIIIGLLISLYLERAEESQAEDDKATAYISEKYGMEAMIVNKTEPNFVESLGYQMAFEEQPDLVFTVEVHLDNYATVYRDDYKVIRATQEIQQQVKELMPQLEELGFTENPSEELVHHILKNIATGEVARFLNLSSESDYATLEMAEIEAMATLFRLVKEHNLDIHLIGLASKQDASSIGMDLREMEDVDSIEEIQAAILQTNPRLFNDELNATWQDAAAQAETERFRFHNESDENWLVCQQVKKGRCIILKATVTFEAGQFSKQNPNLADDMEAIFGFFDAMEPAPAAVDLELAEVGSDMDPSYLSLHERQDFESTEELIEDMLHWE
ncbi:hypothetical protein QOZ98_001193 [Planomicrobium stackebrandtii]|uniref:Uncharacterized protein n=1 Tax=Planomicrobium stackebrandtii TaxID=253160 RepID=A0ABU0GSN3_9BACL|nr:hypothetical protein [Planomicrobium stackebrandtii]MDQ0428367.1 hypothetical protein [Planomicrobium stackebrandtii]